MPLPLCKNTLFTTVVITTILAVAFFFYPLLALSFEAGLVVGLLLHSNHLTENVDCGNIVRKL